jgi:transcriptional regulator with XRE-family HTH domain
MSKSKRDTLAGDLRQAINESGISMYKLAQDTGVSRSQLSRFMREERDLSLGVANKLCEVLGLRLIGSKPIAVRNSVSADAAAGKPVASENTEMANVAAGKAKMAKMKGTKPAKGAKENK